LQAVNGIGSPSPTTPTAPHKAYIINKRQEEMEWPRLELDTKGKREHALAVSLATAIHAGINRNKAMKICKIKLNQLHLHLMSGSGGNTSIFNLKFT